MKSKIFWSLLSIFKPNVQYKRYTNQRYEIIRNGGCIVYLHDIKVAHLYAIVDTCGDIVEVTQQGIFAPFFKEEMEQQLLEHMTIEEGKQEHPRYLKFNYIDTPLR